jgi:hypothetical protein
LSGARPIGGPLVLSPVGALPRQRGFNLTEAELAHLPRSLISGLWEAIDRQEVQVGEASSREVPARMVSSLI